MDMSGDKTIPELDPDPERETPNEWTMSERPLLRQLAVMGWTYLQGDIDYPQKTFRDRFRDVLLKPRLREAIRRINASECLDDVTIERAIEVLERSEKQGGLERNRELTEKLITGVSVLRAEGAAEGGSRNVTVHFIDFERPESNDLLAINQFRVDPIGRTGFTIPDIVLFVNGIPLVLIECKSPDLAEVADEGWWKPIEAGINQMLRYSNMRDDVEADEGVEQLFHWNQLMVSTCYYDARVGGYGAGYKDYSRWKDTTPKSEAEVLEEVGRSGGKLHAQEVLAAGMLRPANLLEILRHFILFQVEDGRLIKLVPRYQQFRAVHNAVARLTTGKTLQQSDKRRDERGGIIWHTQGSGKSITMMHLVRKMRSTEALRAFKVVVVTDRTSLEAQLRVTAHLTGEIPRPNEQDMKQKESGSDRLKRILSEDGPDLVFCMIQKNQERDGEVEILEYEIPLPPPRLLVKEDDAEYGPDAGQLDAATRAAADAMIAGEPPGSYGRTRKVREIIRNNDDYPVLNESPKILLLIDECHRSHSLTLHANLMKALPNAAKIGFTGTPIMNKDRGNTLSIFDDFIDKYRLQEAVDDEATVPIIYTGRVPKGLVENAAMLDQVAAVEFSEFTAAEQQLIMEKFATEAKVLEAPKVIAVKARDMLHHYVREILRGGFKAQVVAVSQQAAVRYQKALEEARDELVAEAEKADPALLASSEEDLLKHTEWDQTLVWAHRQRDRVKVLEFAAVISGRHNQSGDWNKWSEPEAIKANIANFKKPFEHKDPEKRSNVAMLCVMRMLLTGFDAPIEQALYLDRRSREHDLLQTIARVNRKKAGKEVGYLVDYIGIARALKEALTDSEEGADGGERPGTGTAGIMDEIPKLRDRHQRVLDVFMGRGIPALVPIDPCVELLEDEKVRAEFINRLRAFFGSLAIVMPRPEALPYLRDAKILGFIAKVAALLYRDGALNLEGVDSRVRRLIDEYVSTQGIDPKVPPISILDVNFSERLKGKKSKRARASEMKHALRFHIRAKTDDDPAYYRSLSQRLEEILKLLEDNWDELVRELERLIQEVRARDSEEQIEGLDAKVHAPFLGLLVEAAKGTASIDATTPEFREFVDLKKEIVAEIRNHIVIVDFWRDGPSHRYLESAVYRILFRSPMLPADKRTELASRLVELARTRHRWLV